MTLIKNEYIEECASVGFVEEVHELLEVYLIIRLHACDLYHSADLVIRHVLPQNAEDLLQVFLVDVSLLLPVKH